MFGAVAQLGEHHNGIVGVKGSSPFSSTKQEAGSLSGQLPFFGNQGGTAESLRPCRTMGFFYFPHLFTFSRITLYV